MDVTALAVSVKLSDASALVGTSVGVGDADASDGEGTMEDSVAKSGSTLSSNEVLAASVVETTGSCDAVLSTAVVDASALAVSEELSDTSALVETSVEVGDADDDEGVVTGSGRQSPVGRPWPFRTAPQRQRHVCSSHSPPRAPSHSSPTSGLSLPSPHLGASRHCMVDSSSPYLQRQVAASQLGSAGSSHCSPSSTTRLPHLG